MNGGTTELAKSLLRMQPDGEVQIAAFVPDLDACAPKLTEARNFLP
jgi:hypothetical protein